ncbi:MAG TPA: NAD-dependent epimerase/dehydratase family protein [Nitrospirae bacterium]|nr:NAD-dependent epimerase/dehydratase family protein [Nitrospirota bacterium]
MESLKDKKILIIGGAGFIGHNMAITLAGLGAKVAVIDGLQVNNLLSFAALDPSNKNQELYYDILNQRLQLLFKAGVGLEVADARDYAVLSHLFTKIRPNIVIQLAAVSHAGKSNKDPFSTFDHSLRTLENALDCSRDYVERFIFFSSSMVYGHFTEETVTEDTHCEPLGIYGALKFSGEKLVIAYNQVFNLPYTIIRPSALYGERCVSRRVLQIFAENSLRNEEITIHGDGNDRLDFTYIDDMINGVVKVLTSKKAVNEIFNITYGQGRSMAEVVDIIRKQFPDARVNYTPKDNLTPDRGTLSIDKAKRLIGYEPAFPIEIGLPKYIDWYRDAMKKHF